MFDTICSLPLTSEIFALSIHPKEPIFAAGLAGGHVEVRKLPEILDAEGNYTQCDAETGFGCVELAWRTRRHKGSCRCLSFGADPDVLYSAGTDGILKVASTESGQVISKIAIPQDQSSHFENAPTVIHALSPQNLLLATDSGSLCVYDLRAPTYFTSPQRPQTVLFPHEDYISSIAPLSPSSTSTSGTSKQWVSTGATTLAVTDLRRGVLVQSIDQRDDLLSCLFVDGLPTKGGRRSGEKVIVGNSSGLMTTWERGAWLDQDERIVVARARFESIDSLAVLPERMQLGGKVIAAGMGDGSVRFVELGINMVVDGCQHDDVESVVGLGFDVSGRMISGGGEVIKLWHEKVEGDPPGASATTNGHYSGESEDDDDDEASFSDEPVPGGQRKRRRKGDGREKGKDKHRVQFAGLD
ncbi:MAG: WD repeat-containing protein jip5 [Trizodia sp. TS-e1964]|nr:MAG: WD repeat-containing protein jip5 [Trizodia sp. TS-e1964]